MRNVIALSLSLLVTSILLQVAHAEERADSRWLVADMDRGKGEMAQGKAKKVRDKHMDHAKDDDGEMLGDDEDKDRDKSKHKNKMKNKGDDADHPEGAMSAGKRHGDADKSRDKRMMDHAKDRDADMTGDDEDDDKAKRKNKMKNVGDDTAEAQGKGRDMSQEMRERRDERKQIMEQHKGQSVEGEPRMGKKPWWKFWEQETETEALE